MTIEGELESYFDRLWPICRSITGDGLRNSLKILQELIPLSIEEFPTGKKVFDWVVPKEWNIRDAYVANSKGERIIDFKNNNLHIVNYSIPVNEKMSFSDLSSKLHYLKDQPNAIPYITSYYKEQWGFCLSYDHYKSLDRSETYHVVIDSTLEEGSLSYGEYLLQGESEKEVLISTYLCHPSMANNELSGPLVAAFLYKELLKLKKRKYSYRFVFAPETIGVICFLSRRGEILKNNLIAGYVLTCCGDEGDFVYKRSKHDNSLADRVAENVLKHQHVNFTSIPFSVGGSDERQYCSPGFNLPVGSLTRSMYRHYKEYHTSLDNKEFISFEAMKHTIDVYLNFIKGIELNDKYFNKVQYCEPQLGKRDMYPSSGAWMKSTDYLYNLLHFLSFADGQMDLVEIAERKGCSVCDFEEVIENCREKGLIK